MGTQKVLKIVTSSCKCHFGPFHSAVAHREKPNYKTMYLSQFLELRGQISTVSMQSVALPVTPIGSVGYETKNFFFLTMDLPDREFYGGHSDWFKMSKNSF